MERLVVFAFVLPLVAALLTWSSATRLSSSSARISILGNVATFALTAVALFLALAGKPATQVQLGTTWGILLFDPLSALMAFVVSGISLLVHVYSIRYMAEERGYARFFVLLDLMTAVLLLMVSAGDLVTLLIAWHLIGVLLYFLLGHDTTSQSAHRYASWTLLTYRFGDLPLLLAAGLLYHAYGTWSLHEVFAHLASAPDARTVFGLPLAETVAGLVALAAFARSAQFLI